MKDIMDRKAFINSIYQMDLLRIKRESNKIRKKIISRQLTHFINNVLIEGIKK